MTRKIIIPEDILEQLKLLTEMENEINGIMLYRPTQIHGETACVVESFFFTGSGTGASVSRDPQRLRVINQFLKENPEYKIIDFHTHPRRLGDHWHRNFSGQDIETFRDHLQDDPHYIGMLITPTHNLLYAPDSPELRTCSPLPKFMHEKVQRKINEASERIGIRLGTFDLGRFPEPRRLARRRTITIAKRPLSRPK